MATQHPKDKAKGWTVLELRAITPANKGDTLADGGGLLGEVRVLKDGTVSVRFKYAFKWQGKVCWFQCGTWPSPCQSSSRWPAAPEGAATGRCIAGLRAD